MGSKVERAIGHLVVLVVDSSAYMRKLMRTMLGQCGVHAVYEAGDGIAALEAIRSVNPDVLIINWDLPVLTGSEVVRMVRSPKAFPKSDLPVIMLLDDGLCSRVMNAAQLGVHELLIKPISAKMLQERLLAMGGLAEERVRQAVTALSERSAALVDHVLSGDEPIRRGVDGVASSGMNRFKYTLAPGGSVVTDTV